MICFHIVHDTSSRLRISRAGVLNWLRNRISWV
ncbi:hypothetical protein [Cutibacterium phage vB_CutS_PA1]|nr:hypothetical protein [Cutibacterium phage vB_CutS_PA1]